MHDPTPRQLEVAAHVLAYVEKHRCSPTVREVAAHFAINPNAANRHLKVCEAKGLLKPVTSASGQPRGWVAP